MFIYIRRGWQLDHKEEKQETICNMNNEHKHLHSVCTDIHTLLGCVLYY